MINRTLVLTTTVICFMFLFSCSKSPKSVEYYKANPQEMAAVLEKYKNNPDAYTNDLDVNNARDAAFKLNHDRLYGGWAEKGKRVVDPTINKLH